MTMAAAPLSLKAGQRTKVISYLSDSMTRTLSFTAQAADGTPPDGVVEIESRQFLLKAKYVQHPLQETNSFVKSWIESPYAIYVTPTKDLTVDFGGKAGSGQLWLYVLIGVALVGLIAAASLAMFIR